MVKQYLTHSRTILSDDRSVYKPNRTGIDSISLFGYQNEYKLSDGFPLLTTKKMAWKGITHELLWFMRGESNIKYLVDNGVHIWTDNAFQHFLKQTGWVKELPMYSPGWFGERTNYIERIKHDAEFARVHGELGPVYGTQWRHWKTSDGRELDQFGDAIKLLKKSPQSRRIIVSAWNPEDLPNMALPPCHTLFHFNVADGKLDCQLYQRSCDMFLGVPFNIASYSMLTHIVAQETGLEVGRFIHTFGDSHFYSGAGERGRFYGEHLDELKRRIGQANKPEHFMDTLEWIDKKAPKEEEGKVGQDHVTAILEQLAREPKGLPKLVIAKKPLEQLTIDDISFNGYEPHPQIKRAMAV